MLVCVCACVYVQDCYTGITQPVPSPRIQCPHIIRLANQTWTSLQTSGPGPQLSSQIAIYPNGLELYLVDVL